MDAPDRIDQATSRQWRSVERPPWLVYVSPDGLRWTIRGGIRPQKDIAEINFDITFPDGSRLGDELHREKLDMAQAYAMRFRLVHPESSANNHARRVSDLLTFFSWLNLNNIPCLESVTKDQLDRYVREVSLGSEWALQVPHRIIRAISLAFENARRGPEMMPRYRHQIARRPLYESINLGGRRAFPFLHGCSVLDWYDQGGWTVEEWKSEDTVLRKSGVKPVPVTRASLTLKLTPLEEIYLWRGDLTGDTFSFPPFENGAGRAARLYGVATERTPIIPPKVAFRYLALAARWIAEVSPIVFAFVDGAISSREVERQLGELGIDLKIVEPGWQKISTSRMSASVEGLQRLLAAASFSIIAGLTARRVEEVADLEAGCVEPGEDGQLWMKVWIEKTLQRYDVIPVPAIVGRAITCLERLSVKARETSEQASLWQTVQGGEVVLLRGDLYLNELAVLGATKEDEWVGEWHLTPHQFRRFFALLYFWRYDGAYIGALSHHLRHFDIEMTKRYVLDPEGRRAFQEIAGLYRTEVLREIIQKGKAIGGLAGARLKKSVQVLIRRLRATVDVVTPDRVVEKVARMAERNGVDFTLHVWGTICACPSRRRIAAVAKCRGDRPTGPVIKNATEAHCAGCPFAIHTDRFRTAAQEALDSRHAIEESESTLLADLYKVQIASLEHALSLADPSPIVIEGT